jgi:hypothetical protein
LGNPSEALVAFVPPVSIDDRLLHWTLVKSQTYYPSTYLLMGARRLITLFSWVPAFFGPTVRGEK